MIAVNLWRAFTLFWQLFIGLTVAGIFAVTLFGTGTDWETVAMGGLSTAFVIAAIVEIVRWTRERERA